MILLFGEKANSDSLFAFNTTTTKTPNRPVENSGILAMNSFGMYDNFVSSNPVAVDYAMYEGFYDCDGADVAFMSSFSNAYSTLCSEGGFTSDCGSFSSGFSSGFSSDCGSCSSSCGSFSSVC